MVKEKSKTNTFEFHDSKIESEFDDREYDLTLTHREIRELLHWFPKNWETDDEIIMPIKAKLEDATEVVKEQSI